MRRRESWRDEMWVSGKSSRIWLVDLALVEQRARKVRESLSVVGLARIFEDEAV